MKVAQMSVNSSILHFDEHLNATVCIGLAGCQGSEAENAASPGLSVAHKHPVCLKPPAAALSTNHPRGDVLLKSRELQKPHLFPKSGFCFVFSPKSNVVLSEFNSDLFHK